MAGARLCLYAVFFSAIFPNWREGSMAIVEIPIGPPYGNVPVNTATICAAIPHPAAPNAATDLLIDAAGGRSVVALLDIGQVGNLLGADFVQLTMADPARGACCVRRTGWVTIVPHPQIEGVAEINFTNRYIAVVGSVDDVRSKLEAP